MEAIKIKIGKEEFSLKKTFRGLLLLEEMTGKSVTDLEENTTNMLKMFYCFLKACNEDFTFSFDEFLNLIDEDENSVYQFGLYMANLTKKKV